MENTIDVSFSVNAEGLMHRIKETYTDNKIAALKICDALDMTLQQTIDLLAGRLVLSNDKNGQIIGKYIDNPIIDNVNCEFLEKYAKMNASMQNTIDCIAILENTLHEKEAELREKYQREYADMDDDDIDIDDIDDNDAEMSENGLINKFERLLIKIFSINKDVTSFFEREKNRLVYPNLDYLIYNIGFPIAMQTLAKVMDEDDFDSEDAIKKYWTSDTFLTIAEFYFNSGSWYPKKVFYDSIMQQREALLADIKYDGHKYPINAWISPDLEIYSCNAADHIQTAEKITKEMKIKVIDIGRPDATLMKLGWLKISNCRIYYAKHIDDNIKMLNFLSDYISDRKIESIIYNDRTFSSLSDLFDYDEKNIDV